MTNKKMNSRERFTQTVENYHQYRPSYPQSIIDILVTECGFNQTTIVADIGSGTGLLTQLFLDQGNQVFAVEPNDAMRTKAEKILKPNKHFISISGSAESTTLADSSIDMVVVGTAFHWFHHRQSKQEFKRILRKPGWVILIWNTRYLQSPLMKDYEQLIHRYNKDFYESAASVFDQSATESFFSPYSMKTCSIRFEQYFDWQGFKGRLLSTSYVLKPEDKDYDAMIAELRKIFETHQHEGKIQFLYETKMHYGHLHPFI